MHFSHKAKEEGREGAEGWSNHGMIILGLLCCVCPGGRLWASGTVAAGH